MAGVLVGANTLAFVLGAAAAGLLRQTEAGMAVGLVSIAAGDLILAGARLPATGALATGAVVNGAGMGLFWIGTMAALGRGVGAKGSPGAFVGQYVVYTIGNAAGGLLTGGAIAWLLALGVGTRTSIRLSFLLGILCAAACSAVRCTTPLPHSGPAEPRRDFSFHMWYTIPSRSIGVRSGGGHLMRNDSAPSRPRALSGVDGAA